MRRYFTPCLRCPSAQDVLGMASTPLHALGTLGTNDQQERVQQTGEFSRIVEYAGYVVLLDQQNAI